MPSAASPGSVAAERGDPFVAPRGMRGEQGNPEITTYCPKCDDRVVVLASGICGWCETDLSGAADPEPHAPPPPDDVPAAPTPAKGSREDVQVAAWRRDQIFEWVYGDGPKTIADVKDHFELSQAVATADIAHLRTEGRLERTGNERQGPRGGRPSAEFRAVAVEAPDIEPPVPAEPLGAAGEDIDQDGEPKTIGERIAERRHISIDPTPFGDRPGATEHTRAISEQVRREIEGPPVVDDGDAPITVHERLVVRYVTSLICWIERSSTIPSDPGPPVEIYDRIERLLGITEGAA